MKGLGKGAVQAILAGYGIRRTLAGEGGRTSRGSIANMRRCVDFLNDCHARALDAATGREAAFLGGILRNRPRTSGRNGEVAGRPSNGRHVLAIMHSKCIITYKEAQHGQRLHQTIS